MKHVISKVLSFIILSIFVFRFHLFGQMEQLYILTFMFIVGVCSCIVLLKYTILKNIPFPKYNLVFCLLLIYLSLSLIYMKYEFMLISGWSLLIVYAAVLLFSEYVHVNRLFWELYRYYAYGVFVACLLLLAASRIPFFNITMLDNRFGWVYYDGTDISDPNYFAVFIGLAMFYFYFASRMKVENRRYIQRLAFILLACFLLGTLSRGVVLSFIAAFLTAYVIQERNKMKTIILTCLSMCIVPFLPMLLMKFGSQSAADLNYMSIDRFLLLTSSERFDVWRSIWEGFISSDWFTIIWGNGFQSGSSIGAKYYFGYEPTMLNPIFKNPHNMYLQLFVETGLIGMLLLLIVFALYVRQLLTSIRHHNYVPLFLSLFFISVNFSLNTMGFRELSLVFGILLLSSIRLERPVLK